MKPSATSAAAAGVGSRIPASVLQLPGSTTACLSVHRSSMMCALASSQTMYLINLQNSSEGLTLADQLSFNTNGSGSTTLSSSSSTQGNFIITDLAWNSQDMDRLAVSSRGGGIVVVDTNIGKNYVSPTLIKKQNALPHWEISDNKNRPINRLAWHPQNRDTLAAAIDGTIKFYDCRASGGGGGMSSVVATFDAHSEIARDVQFDPFNEHQFAAIYDNGCWILYDSRNTEHGLSKIQAHIKPGLSLSWHLSKPNVLATGSSDKTLKIWNLSNLAKNSSDKKAAEVTIHSPWSVGRIAWRPNHVGAKSDLDQLAVTSGSDRGDISLWDINTFNRNSCPVCVIRGNSDSCLDLGWVDTLIDNDVQDSDDSKEALGVNQHIASIGKDGSFQVHDVRNGFFPSQHIPQNISSISSKGHVVLHKGYIHRDETYQLSCNQKTKLGIGCFAETPSNFGIPSMISSDSSLEPENRNYNSNSNSNNNNSSSSSSNHIDATISNPNDVTSGNNNNNDATSTSTAAIAASTDKLSDKSTDNTLQFLKDNTGYIHIGMAKIEDFGEARELRKIDEVSAEGSVFDPAMIRLLAVSYRYCWYDFQVLDACNHNRNISKAAGLRCRAAMWSAISSILESASCVADSGDLNLNSNLKCKAAPNMEVPHREGLDGSIGSSGSAAAALTVDTGVNESQNQSQSRGEKMDSSNNYSSNTGLSTACTVDDEGHNPSSNSNSSSSNNNSQGSGLTNSRESINELLPFIAYSLGSLLKELLEGGDCQHFVLICEVLKVAGVLNDVFHAIRIPTASVRDAYLAYIDILNKLELFTSAVDIIMHSDDEYIQKLGKSNVIIYSSCSLCKKEVLEVLMDHDAPPQHTQPKSSSDLNQKVDKEQKARKKSPYCSKCQVNPSLCSICERPVTGLFLLCPVCAHGGHRECLRQWFSTCSACPAGCSHDCCDPRSLLEVDSSATFEAIRPQLVITRKKVYSL